MYFYITFRNRKTRDTKTLRWVLCKNPVTYSWAKQVKEQAGHLRFTQLSFPSIIDEIEISKKIKSIVYSLNDLGANLPVWEVTETIDQSKLNRLHEAFHKFEDRVSGRVDKSKFIQRTNEVLNLFQSLNRNIHILEGFLNDKKTHLSPNNSGKHATHSYCVVQATGKKNICNKTIIDDHIREKYFLNSRASNYNIPCLYLGYATIGKNLNHCYYDNDTDIVKQKLLSPQEYIKSEFCISLNSCELPGEDTVTLEEKHIQHLKSVSQWVVENDLHNYVDLTDPKNVYSGQPLLGKMEETMSKEELYFLLSAEEYKITEHGFIENARATKIKYTS